MPKYKLAIFDLDGTLSDSLPWFRRVVNSIADKHRFRRIEDHDVEMLRGKSSREIIKYLAVPVWRIPLIARDMRRLKSECIDSIPLFPGVEAMLQELSRLGVTLAVVSSDSASNVRMALGKNAELISQFACGASLFGKAAKFRTVVRRTGIAAADAICIGDEVRDGEAGRDRFRGGVLGLCQDRCAATDLAGPGVRQRRGYRKTYLARAYLARACVV